MSVELFSCQTNLPIAVCTPVLNPSLLPRRRFVRATLTDLDCILQLDGFLLESDGMRSYEQYCGIARALDLVGERWALLVVRELILGPKRFTDLRRGLPGIATNVLTERLKQLERDGVVRRRTLPPPAASVVYELTEYGRELEPTLLAFGRWGAKSLGPRGGKQLVRPEWFCVALKAFFQPEAARGVRATVDLDLDGERFAVRIDRGSLEISAGAPDAS